MMKFHTMRSRIGLLVLVALAGCSRGPRVEKEIRIFPATVEGGYRLGRVFQVPMEGAPPLARQLGLKAEARGAYEGPSPMTVVLYEMANSTAAFELLQKFPKPAPAEAKPKAGKGDDVRRMLFQRGRYFVVVETNGDDTTQLKPFTTALEKALPN